MKDIIIEHTVNIYYITAFYNLQKIISKGYSKPIFLFINDSYSIEKHHKKKRLYYTDAFKQQTNNHPSKK